MKCKIFVAVTILATLTHAEDPWTPSPLCPYPSESLTRFPYEGDCTKWWECFEGARYIMTCPEGLEYNEREERCDTPSIAQCNKYETITYPTFSHSVEPGDSTGTTSAVSLDPLCPFSEIIVFYPYPFNCSQYWECFEGKRYLMNCPRNLYWNVKYSYCDYLDNVDCSLNTNPVTPAPQTDAPPTEPTVFPDPLCPYPSDELVFFPYPLNCSQYWECYEGTKYLMTCPSNLVWNEYANVCDYAVNVDCSRVVVTTAPPEPTPTSNTTVEDAESTEPEVTTAPSETVTPGSLCSVLPNGSYVANPANCRQFFECDNGKEVLETCPGNLLWNQEKLSCDFAVNVNCTV